MKIFRLIVLVLLVFFLTNIGESQDQSNDPFDYFSKPEYFENIANSKPENLVFRFLQFNAPYKGGYNETYLDTTGNVFTVRVTQFARQAQRDAVLSESQIKELKQTLSKFISTNCLETLQPQDKELYSSLIFKNETTFSRCNFIGQIPNELQEMKDFLNAEYDKADEKYIEELDRKEKIVREKYGDWEKNPELIRYSTGGSRNLKNENTQLLYLKGKQQPVTENSKEIPLYYALVLYPTGRIIGGAGGGTTSFDPFLNYGISWAITDGSYKPEKELLIEYSVIENAVSIENKVYKLKRGNLFVLKFDENWVLDVKQLDGSLKEPINDQTILSIFGKELRKKLMFPESK